VSVNLWKKNLGDISASRASLAVIGNPLIASYAAFNWGLGFGKSLRPSIRRKTIWPLRSNPYSNNNTDQ
jgi:hypothetical protein